jgi:rhamnulokinase
MTRRYLALDLGAESGRGILAQLTDHRLELAELNRFPNTPVRLPTGLYWDTLRLFNHACDSIRAAARAVDRLDGIAVDAWGVDFGLVGSSGSLIGNPRHYRDECTRGVQQDVLSKVPREEIFRQTGVQFMDINSLYQLYALQRDSPELIECASKLLFIPDLFNYFLTGTFASERTIASTSQFYDPVNRRFATDMLRALGIEAAFLPELIEAGTSLGTTLPYMAGLCGLAEDISVYATGSHDTAAAVAAVPAAVRENWCYISSGTWSLMGIELNDPLINNASLQANFTNEVGVEHTIRFLKNIPGLWVLQECRRAWSLAGQQYSYTELLERAETARPSDTFLDLDQFVAPGDYPELICSFCRRTDQQVPQDPGEITRVILHSLALRYNQVLNILEQLSGRTIDVIHIVGGGSRNRLLNQLTADATGRRVAAGPAEATAAGNALVQALGAGDIGSLEELRAVVRQSFEVEEFQPNT